MTARCADGTQLREVPLVWLGFAEGLFSFMLQSLSLAPDSFLHPFVQDQDRFPLIVRGLYPSLGS